MEDDEYVDKRKTRTILLCKKDMEINKYKTEIEYLLAEVKRLREDNLSLIQQLQAHEEIRERAQALFQERLSQAIKELEASD